jgi:regulator of protease activity HflC (stomatin/prohibitin superfamily)
MASALIVVGLVIVAVAAAMVYSAVTVVETGQVLALLVFGETLAVLEPGPERRPADRLDDLPIDPDTMTMATETGIVGAPSECRHAVRAMAER